MASAKANAAAIKTDTEEVTDTETKIDADDQPYSPSARVMVEDDPDLPDLAGLIGSSGVAGQNEVRQSASSPCFQSALLLANTFKAQDHCNFLCSFSSSAIA